MMMRQLVVSCEHASNKVPLEYVGLFRNAPPEVLNSHRGWDPGSLEIAQVLAKKFKVEPFIYPYTRLLVEPNRSIGQSQLFSKYSKVLPAEEQRILIDQYYQPYRDSVESHIRKLADHCAVVHVGIHTFTPVWEGKEREVDIGILFDPTRKLETACSLKLIDEMRKHAGDLRIRDNEPYLGIDDGFTTYLRTRFADAVYAGLEIEVSQRFLDRLPAMSDLLGRGVLKTMQADWERSV